MYRPEFSKAVDLQLSFDLIEEFPLGLLISQSAPHSELPQIGYYPFILDAEGGSQFLLGHMARANPQWRLIGQNRVRVQFLGPNSYISPSLYRNKLNVPTWNYAAVSVEGIAEVVEESDPIEEILQKSVRRFESLNQTTWNYDLPEEFRSRLVSAIVGIKIRIDSIEGKFKLSQNRDSEDYESVLAHFETSVLASPQPLARWMRKCP